MKSGVLLTLAILTLLTGCSLEAPDEKAVRQMLETFFSAVQRGDEQLARAILIDREAFVELNPDASARSDAENYTLTHLDDIVSRYRGLVRYFQGRVIEVKKIRLGPIWYQYKGRQAFKDTIVYLDADGEEVQVTIRGVVRINDKWRIADLGGMDEME